MSVTPHQPMAPRLDDGLGEVTRNLARDFAGTFSPETIDRFVAECHGMVIDLLVPPPTNQPQQSSPRTTARVAGLTRQFAAERLQALAQSEGLVAKQVPEVLFVCVHDGGRSQLAAQLTRHLASGRVNVRSAGSRPASMVHPWVIAVLAELGIDASEAYPKPLTDETVRAADVVVTMGCGDSCPVLPDKHYEDWAVGDPIGADIAQTRAVRDDIVGRVQGLLGSLSLQI